MTRRCSVMRMPVAAQRASMPVALSAGVGFSAVIRTVTGTQLQDLALATIAPSATARGSRQVAPHQKGIQRFPAGLSVIAFAAADDGKPGALVKPPRRPIIFLHLQEYRPHAAAGKVAKMCQQKFVGQAAPAMA